MSETRLAAVEARLAGLAPCRCPDDVLTRSDLAPFARSGDVAASIDALRRESESSGGRIAELRDQLFARAKSAAGEAVRERLAGIDLKGLAWTKTRVVLASLGVGGPIGLALLAGRLFLRSRRRRRRRGLGGPRADRFQTAPR